MGFLSALGTTTLLLVTVTLMAHQRPVAAAYQIGVGRADCTGPAAGITFMGYAKLSQVGTGIHLRQFSRAFIIQDKDNKVVFVSADLGMIGYALRDEVIKKLQNRFGNEYDEQNVIISGTHTHGGPGGFLWNILYDITCLGFIEETYNAYAEGIFQSIVKAHENMVEGEIFLNTGTVKDANINRSPTSYLENPEAERKLYTDDVDKELVQLKFVASATNKALGVINWFPVHPTSMNNSNTLITSDNVGYASILFEQAMNPDALPGKGEFVAAFASSNLGDVSPNTQGAKCVNTGYPCDSASSTCLGYSQQCIAFGPGKDMYESTKIIATRISTTAKNVFEGQGTKVSGPIKSVHQFVDIPKESVNYQLKNGTKVTGKGCLPAMGYSFAAGTTDGPGEFDFRQGTVTDNPFWNFLRDQFLVSPTPEDVDCHAPKPILLATGRMNFPFEWSPHIIPTQVALIGNVVLAAIPGEFTTMSGRRMRQQLTETMSSVGGYDPADVKVIIAGLSNIYTGYITTPEEYSVQRYEAASTVFGPYTLPIYLQKYKELLGYLLNDVADVDKGPSPPVYGEPLTFVLPVIKDSAGLTEFGACLLEPQVRAMKGSTVTVKFQAGHPRNNVRQERTFLTVERQNDAMDWDIIATDANWETKFHWHREYLPFRLDIASSTVTIEWTIPQDVPTGLYRINHFGNWKELLEDTIHEYEGTCNPFFVV